MATICNVQFRRYIEQKTLNLPEESTLMTITQNIK